MNRILFPLIVFCISNLSSLAQTFPKKQTLIPLSNINGVPFFKAEDMDDIGVYGFEVDDKGAFYFFGGQGQGCLACFNGTKQVYRKNFVDLLQGGVLYLYKNNLYSFTFDKKGTPVYIKIDATTGAFIKIHGPADKISAAADFIDSCVIFGFPNPNPTKAHYDQYSISGKFMKTASKLTDIRPIFYPDTSRFSPCSLVGTWNGNYVFWNIPESKVYVEKLWLVDKTGKVLATKILPKGFSGTGYVENPDEDRKVRNGSFFVLGRKGKYAMITEIPLQTLFYK